MKDCLPFLKYSIPFWHLSYSILKFPFHSIFHFIQYHALVVDSILLLLFLHFTLTVVASLKFRKRLILKKLLPFPAPFQHFRSEFASASNLFHQSASASTFLYTTQQKFRKYCKNCFKLFLFTLQTATKVENLKLVLKFVVQVKRIRRNS